jgi:hypothetical protein
MVQSDVVYGTPSLYIMHNFQMQRASEVRFLTSEWFVPRDLFFPVGSYFPYCDTDTLDAIQCMRYIIPLRTTSIGNTAMQRAVLGV